MTDITSKKKDISEDNRTIADMSVLPKRAAFFGRNYKLEKTEDTGRNYRPEKADAINREEKLREWEEIDAVEAQREQYMEELSDSPWKSSEMSKDERRAAMKGALGASLLIGAAYAVGIGGFILLLTIIFSHLL